MDSLQLQPPFPQKLPLARHWSCQVVRDNNILGLKERKPSGKEAVLAASGTGQPEKTALLHQGPGSLEAAGSTRCSGSALETLTNGDDRPEGTREGREGNSSHLQLLEGAGTSPRSALREPDPKGSGCPERRGRGRTSPLHRGAAPGNSSAFNSVLSPSRWVLVPHSVAGCRWTLEGLQDRDRAGQSRL